MTQFYIRDTQQLVTDLELRDAFPNISFPDTLTKEILDSVGVDVVLSSPQPTVTDLQTVELSGVKVDDHGNVIQNWIVKPRFTAPGKAAKEKEYLNQLLSTAKELKTADVESIRAEKQKTGVKHQFPGGIGTIQTRNETDLRNIQLILANALALKIQGIEDAIIPFRDQEDHVHMLTPDQMIAVGNAAQSFISDTYQWMWSKKSEIAASKNKTELDKISLA